MENKENTDDKTEFVKKAIRVGNSAGVLLPKSFLGSEVKITVIDKPLNIRKDVMKILENYFENIIGIYIINVSKDLIEVMAISSNLKKMIQSGKYKISIVPLNLIKKDLKISPRLKTKINQAKTILNKALLFELRKNL